MDKDVLKIVGQVAGIGGISLGVFLIIFKELIKKNIFPSLKKDHAYSLLRLILILTWSIAVIGIFAWLLSNYINSGKSGNQPSSILNEDKAVNSLEENKDVWLVSFDVSKNELCAKGESSISIQCRKAPCTELEKQIIAQNVAEARAINILLSHINKKYGDNSKLINFKNSGSVFLKSGYRKYSSQKGDIVEVEYCVKLEKPKI